MAGGGSCNFDDLERFEKQLRKIADEDKLNKFFEDCAKELAEKLRRKVVQRTPVGKAEYINEAVTDENGNKVYYKRGKNKGKIKTKRINVHPTSGNLRKGWSIGTVTKVGDSYQVQISNPESYASYVEYGHRQTPGRFVPAIGKRLKKNWAEGRFMLTISEQELKNLTPKFLEKKLKEYLQRCFYD